MIKRILSIDIGFKNPAFVIIAVEENKENIKNIKFINIYTNLEIKDIQIDTSFILEYFISEKIDIVIIENQFTLKNSKLMSFIQGYCSAKKIKTIIRQPISNLRNNKIFKNRSLKKGFSVDCLNTILNSQNINIKFLKKHSDICDAINICLFYLYELKNNRRDKDFLNNYNIPIEIIKFIRLKIIN